MTSSAHFSDGPWEGLTRAFPGDVPPSRIIIENFEHRTGKRWQTQYVRTWFANERARAQGGVMEPTDERVNLYYPLSCWLCGGELATFVSSVQEVNRMSPVEAPRTVKRWLVTVSSQCLRVEAHTKTHDPVAIDVGDRLMLGEKVLWELNVSCPRVA